MPKPTASATAAEFARHQLIQKHQGLVRALAQSIQDSLGTPFDLDDLIAYGQIGLAQCADSYDESKNIKFSTYAYHRIRGAIYDGISEMNWLSSEDYKNHELEVLSTYVLAEEDNDEEASAWLEKNVGRMFMIGLTLEAVEKETDGLSPSAALETTEANSLVREAIRGLPEREKYLIEQIYFERSSFTSVAAKLGITKSGVSRMHKRVLNRLAEELESCGSSS